MTNPTPPDTASSIDAVLDRYDVAHGAVSHWQRTDESKKALAEAHQSIQAIIEQEQRAMLERLRAHVHSYIDYYDAVPVSAIDAERARLTKETPDA
jgi:C4-type Zn-finger protein